MYTKRFFFLILVPFLFACGSHSTPSYLISGTVTGAGVEEVYLQQFIMSEKAFHNVETAKVSQGRFGFKGSLVVPALFRIAVPSGQYVELFIENSNITVDINTAGRPSDNLVKGSLSDSVYKAAMRSNDLAGEIQRNPASYSLPYILYRYHTYNKSPEELEALAALFSPQVVENSPYMKLLNQLIGAYRNVAIGKLFTEIALPDPDGKVRKLSEYVGNYLLLDFWASWCPPCRAENPNLVKLYQKYHPKGFEIYAVSLDKTKEAWLKGIEEDQLPWIHVSNIKFWDCEASMAYGARSIPTNLLIDPQGIIIARNLMG